jgi:hypothetical protein
MDTSTPRVVCTHRAHTVEEVLRKRKGGGMINEMSSDGGRVLGCLCHVAYGGAASTEIGNHKRSEARE